MQINVSLSGTVRFVHEVPQGTSPLATLDDLKAMETRIVSVLTDKIAAADAALGTKIDSATTRVLNDVATLNQTIDDLRAQLLAGGASPEEVAAFDAFAAKAQNRVDQIDPTSPVVLPPTP